MDIFNRPPSIAEDTLQYTIYPPSESSDKASVTALAACISSTVDSMLPNFIWNRDSFEVKVVPSEETKGSWILEGRMRVGDCVDDEWCMVWLLKEISARWDVLVSVLDSDGEFLLIEAAEALPSWVTPTNSENRVWIYCSRLHLVPLAYVSSRSATRKRRKLPGAPESDDEDLTGNNDEAFISVSDAVRLVRNTEVDTFAPFTVEKLVWQRISRYPTAIKDHLHLTKAYIPEDIAKALVANPALVQRATEMFYTRDAIQLRAAHRMSRFPPSTAVLASVHLTRTAYAQLSGQKFFPPKIFGHWKDLEGSNEWRWKDIGMKIAAGFEMLYQESKSRKETQNTSPEGIRSMSEGRRDALRRDPEYKQYIKNLTLASYFKGEIQGSALWNQLEDEAASTFLGVRSTDNASRPSFSVQVESAISKQAQLPANLDRGEDADTWLNIDAENFDQMLEKTFHKGQNLSNAPDKMEVEDQNAEDKMTSEQAKRLKDLASKVEDFVEAEGDIEGVRFENDILSDETSSEDSDDDMDDSEILNSHPNVDQQAAMEKLVSPLDPSEYGKMPASFYANSQRTALSGADSTADPSSAESQKAPSSPREVLSDRPRRAPIIPRDKYDGVDSDDETDPEDEIDEESDEEKPQVLGDIEIDMEQEEEEFLEFSRHALGINDEEWAMIVKDRRDRGAFLPSSATKASRVSAREKSSLAPAKQPSPTDSNPLGQQASVKEELNSFEAVMNALDAVLAQQNPQLQNKTPHPGRKARTHKMPDTKGKGKQMASVEEVSSDEDADDDDFDVDAAMEAELKAALQVDEIGGEGLDYNLIKNFLESFKSQGGLSGPVSNLSGMLAPDLTFPRDSSA